MLTLLMTLGLALLATIGLILVLAALRPGTFKVSRSTKIEAPADKIFPLINDLSRFNEWNPFLKKDPAVRLSYSGPPNGVGAAHEWDGNGNVGKGHVSILQSTIPSHILMQLVMIKPISADNRVEFTLRPDGTATEVTWTMSGGQPFLAKVLSVLIDCDKMVGKDFEIGLADLKARAES